MGQEINNAIIKEAKWTIYQGRQRILMRNGLPINLGNVFLFERYFNGINHE